MDNLEDSKLIQGLEFPWYFNVQILGVITTFIQLYNNDNDLR